MVIRIHRFVTLTDANSAISIINFGEGIPKSSGSQTQTYTVPRRQDLSFWYIFADIITKKYLGQGEDFDFPPMTN